MDLAIKKLSIIERLMRVREEKVLKHYEDLLIKAEIHSRTEESLKAIDKGEVVDLESFKNNNKAWLNDHLTKSE